MPANNSMPPASTKAPKIANGTAAQLLSPGPHLTLFHANLNAIREWYKQQPNAGHNHGLNITMELALSHTLTALGNALEGKTWEPPT